MSKLLPILLALGFIVMSAPVPAFAQKQQKQSCQAICAKRCEMANTRNLCMPNCMSKCNTNQSGKK